MRRPTVIVALLACALPASASAAVRVERLAGFRAPGTPAKYNKVGILEIGPRSAPNILVLNPGTSASAAYFAPLARDIVRKAKRWQVWAVERSGGQRVLDAAKALARQSHIPKRNLTLVDRHASYAHNDPNSAAPRNAFVKGLVPFLRRIAGRP